MWRYGECEALWRWACACWVNAVVGSCYRKQAFRRQHLLWIIGHRNMGVNLRAGSRTGRFRETKIRLAAAERYALPRFEPDCWRWDFCVRVQAVSSGPRETKKQPLVPEKSVLTTVRQRFVAVFADFKRWFCALSCSQFGEVVTPAYYYSMDDPH
jgi:hypothetical protein